MSVNPYEAPGQAAPTARAVSTTPEVVKILVETRPWVTFLGVIGLLSSFMLAAIGAFMFYGVSGVPSELMYFAFAYLVIAALYVPPSVYLLRYRSAITRLEAGSETALVEALRTQKAFWKFVGSIVGLIIVVYIAIVVVAVLQKH